MHIDELTKIAENFTRTALCGVTKEQILRTYKEAYNLSDNEIKALLILCNFKSAPKSINSNSSSSASTPSLLMLKKQILYNQRLY